MTETRDYETTKLHFKSEMAVCKYGHSYPIGVWPTCRGVAFAADHGVPAVRGRDPFEPYFDEHIVEGGAHITSRGHRDAICKREKLNRG